MIKRTPTAFALATVGLSVFAAGCSHPAATGGDSLAQQKAGVMGSPAPPEVQAEIAKQQAAQRAAMQQGAQQAQQRAKQAAPPK